MTLYPHLAPLVIALELVTMLGIGCGCMGWGGKRKNERNKHV